MNDNTWRAFMDSFATPHSERQANIHRQVIDDGSFNRIVRTYSSELDAKAAIEKIRESNAGDSMWESFRIEKIETPKPHEVERRFSNMITFPEGTYSIKSITDNTYDIITANGKWVLDKFMVEMESGRWFILGTIDEPFIGETVTSDLTTAQFKHLINVCNELNHFYPIGSKFINSENSDIEYTSADYFTITNFGENISVNLRIGDALSHSNRKVIYLEPIENKRTFKSSIQLLKDNGINI